MQAINKTGSLKLLGSRRMCFIWKGEIYYSVFHINVLEGARCSDLYFILGMEAALEACPGAPRAGAGTGSAAGAAGQQRAVPELHGALHCSACTEVTTQSGGLCLSWSVKSSEAFSYLSLINNTVLYRTSLAEQFLQC